MTPTPVTVVGLGPMGRAMAGAFLEAGHPTTVFNRTPGKDDEFVRTGARRADSADAALAASDLIVLSLTHYQAMYDLLGSATDGLAGKTLVNLSSDTPRESERASAWAGEHGADFLTGGIMVPAELVGQEGAYTFYSGPEAVLERHRKALEVLSRIDYRGEDAGLAQLWYQAQLDLFMTVLASVAHATALLGSAGVRAETFIPYANETLTGMPYFLEGLAEQIDNRTYLDQGASLAMMAAGIDHITTASEAAGIDPGLPAAVSDLYQRGLADGRGTQSWASLIEMIKAPQGEDAVA